MSGPSEVIEKQKSNFDSFVKSIEFGESEDPAKPQAAESDVSASDISYEVPAGWTRQEPKPMRLVSFVAPVGDKQAELIVTKLPSSASGGYLDNVNRWRGQAGLPAIQQGDQQTSQTMTVGRAEGALFDFSGPEKRLLVAWVPKGQDWWFFKFAGPTDVVTQQQPAFDGFLKSVRFVTGAGERGERSPQ
jgi:hypothetical protein